MLNSWRRREGCGCEGVKPSVVSAVLPLCDAPAGKPLKVSVVGGGRRLCARMASMGIYPGVVMEVLCAGCGSPCLVRVSGGTLSLGKGVSENILVTAAG